jgi:nucleoside-diphosphate-sugar epimerase
MNIAISGANGFVGSSLRRSIQRLQWEVNPITRTPTDSSATGHLSDPWSTTAWSHALGDADTLIHLIGRAHHTAETGSEIDAYRRDNVHVLESVLAADSQLESIIFLSSVKAIGERTEGVPFTDATACEPTTAYGQSKMEAERLLRHWAATGGRSASCIRPPLIYGPGVRGNLKSLIRIADSPIPLPMRSLRNRRSLLSVDNLTSSIKSLVERPTVGFRTFTLSDSSPVSTADIVTFLRVGLGRSPRLFSAPIGALRTPLSTIGQGDRIARPTEDLEIDPTAAFDAIGIVPTVDTPTGLTQLGSLARQA